ncbi:MAG: hypothetical protein AAF394_08785 [Planctomycetota bacterium]
MQLPERLTEAQRKDVKLKSFRSSPVLHQIDDGVLVAQEVANSPINTLAAGVMECSVAYATCDRSGIDLPLIGFVANERLRQLRVQHLLTNEATTRPGRLACFTEQFVYAICTCAIRDHHWVDAIIVPCQLGSLTDESLLTSAFDGYSTTIRLKHGDSRPWSSRRH